MMKRDHAQIVRNDLVASRQNFVKSQPGHSLSLAQDQLVRLGLRHFDAEENLAGSARFEPQIEPAADKQAALADRELEFFHHLATQCRFWAFAGFPRSTKQTPSIWKRDAGAILTMLQQISVASLKNKRGHAVKIELLVCNGVQW